MCTEARKVTSLMSLVASLAALCLLTWSAAAGAQEVEIAGKAKLTIKGFISATLFAQNQNFSFGNGQPAEFPVPPEFTTDKWFLDGDVRNTRLTLAFTGPEVSDKLKFGATIEADFFGGFNGTGAFSDEQPNPRLRLAFIDVIKGKTTYRIGQQWSPMFGNVAKSLSHVAFPLGYGSAGDVGWRYPGLFVYHQLGDAGASVSKKVTFAVMRGSWNGPGNNLDSGSAGQASFGPQVELRFDLSGKSGGGGNWGFYLVGHWDEKDLSGANAKAPDDSLTGTAVEIGASYGKGAFSIQGNAYTGKAIGQQFGHITQFGDISGWGAWIQPGFKFNSKWSGYIFYGLDDPDDADVFAAGQSRLKNQLTAASIQYDIGPYSFGLEWLHATLTSGAGGTETDGDQLSMSAMYKF